MIRHRPHVRPHHPGHEEHRQERQDDGDGRENGRGAHLVDGEEGRFAWRQPPELKVAVDVLDVDDGIVDQQSQREDQREERDPVDRVAHHPATEQRQRERHRHRQRHDRRFARAQAQRQQRDDGDHGDGEMLHQLVHLLVGGLAPIARDAHTDVAGYGLAAQLVDARQHVLGDGHGVRPFALGDGDRDGVTHFAGLGIAGPEADARVTRRLRGSVADGRHVPEVHGCAVVDSDHQRCHLGRVRERRPHVHSGLPAVRDEHAGARRARSTGQCVHHVHHRRAARREPSRIDRHADFAGGAADHGDARRVRHLAEALRGLAGDLPQRLRIDLRATLGMERERDERQIVDLDGLDHPARHAGRHAIRVHRDLVVELHDRALSVLADLEAHRDHRLAGTRHRVDVLDAVDLPEQRLEARRHEVLDLAGAGSRKRHQHVRDRHHDLRLFLAGHSCEGRDPSEQREHDQERRELRRQKDVDDLGGEAERLGLHGALPPTTTSSPSARPARTSTRSPMGPNPLRPTRTLSTRMPRSVRTRTVST